MAEIITNGERPRFFDPTRPTAFGLPDGTVRALLAFLVISADVFMQCWYRWAPAVLDTMATVAFTFYFASRTLDMATGGTPSTRAASTPGTRTPIPGASVSVVTPAPVKP
ncbi:MAG: hypothetical protein QN187_17915 [Armatimonadota bacterium]|nr:hypothetical protein [Armatimonadota bacterium]